MLAFLLGLSLLLQSCGSGSKKTDDRELEERKLEIKRDHEVIDATSNFRPGWIEDAEIWAKNYNQDIERFRYFSYETDPQVDKNIACKMAKANARTDVASEVATFIDQQLNSSIEGDPNINPDDPEINTLKKYVSTNLAEKIQALVHGVIVQKTHFEKRKYLKTLGAKKDFTGYTCAVLLKMESKLLKTLIQNAIDMTVNDTKDPETKELVKNKLKNSPDKFKKEETASN